MVKPVLASVAVVVNNEASFPWRSVPWKLPLVVWVAASVAATFHSSASARTIEEIVVTAPTGKHRTAYPSSVERNRVALLDRTPVDMTDLLVNTPAVGTRVNSRGETVIRIRGSEERQTGVFVDGAPIGVPWDSRADLSLLPAGLVENANIIRSAAPIEFGTNAVLGAVDISLVRDCKAICNLRAMGGDHGLRNYDLIAGRSGQGWSATVAGSYKGLDGLDVADESGIPFARIEAGRRANTDSKRGTLWGALDYENDAVSLSMSHLWIDAERGVAAQGNLDPEVYAPRYWRYPEWKLQQTTVNALINLGQSAGLRATYWHQDFAQTIDQHADDRYARITEREEHDDATSGIRLVVYVDRETSGYRVVANVQTTHHEQVDTDMAVPLGAGKEVFEQQLYSLGFEFDRRVSESLRYTVGFSYDWSSTPEAGGRPKQNDLRDWAASLAAQWDFASDFFLSASVGRRTRFPSLRELYGVSLGSFALNPSLGPESVWLADLGVQWQSSELVFEVSPWYLLIDNKLSRRSIVLGGERYRQRFNLKGAKGMGLDFGLSWSPTPRIDLHVGGSVHNLKSKKEASGERPGLFQRPKRQFNATINHRHSDRVHLRADITHLGEALDDGEMGVETLPDSTQLDLRVFYELAARQGWRFFAALENVTDEVVLPQLGLPAPGRTWRIGIEYND